MDSLIKSKIFELVSRSNDEGLLEQVYNILENNMNYKENQLFEQLPDYHKAEILRSLTESGDPNNLLDHEQVMTDIRKSYGWN